MTDASNDPVTLVTTLHVDPEHVDEILDRLRAARDTVMAETPGHLGATFMVSADRSKIMIQGQWRSRSDIDKILFKDEIGERYEHVINKAKSVETVIYRRVE